MCSSCCDPKSVVRLLMRISLGLSLAFIGFTHYGVPDFAQQVASGLGALEPVGYMWGYILPGLMILGGALLAFGIFPVVAASAAGIALASIPAGLLLKSAMGTLPLESSMPAALNALIWLIVLFLAVPVCSCCPCIKSETPSAPPVKQKVAPVVPVVPPTPVRTAPPAPVQKSAAPTPAVTKPAPKKAVAKKVTTKKSTPSVASKGGLDV